MILTILENLINVWLIFSQLVVRHTLFYTTATPVMVEAIRITKDQVQSQLFRTNQFDNHTVHSSRQNLKRSSKPYCPTESILTTDLTSTRTQFCMFFIRYEKFDTSFSLFLGSIFNIYPAKEDIIFQRWNHGLHDFNQDTEHIT